MRKLIAVLLVVTLLTIPFTAYAYKYTYLVEASLSISGGTATCMGAVRPESNSHSASLTMYLKKRVNGSWTTIATWTASGSGVLGASTKKTKSGLASGYSYKVVVSGKVTDSSGKTLETVSLESSERLY